MEPQKNLPARGGPLSRLWKRLSTPSAHWSVLALVIVGLLIGAGGVVATQVMVAATGTNEFCGGACHSMQWVAQEYKQSGHYANSTGVRANCHDCHIPNRYPALLWYKAKAGIKDAIGEMSGVISTQERFKKERLRMATRTGKIGLWDWDVVNNRITWTESLYEIHGVQPGAFEATVEGGTETVRRWG